MSFDVKVTIFEHHAAFFEHQATPFLILLEVNTALFSSVWRQHEIFCPSRSDLIKGSSSPKPEMRDLL